jgi:hypothetical protein
MLSDEQLFRSIDRILETRSQTELGTLGVVGMLELLSAEWGVKSQVQHVSHSLDGVSKDQRNIIFFSGDNRTDRTTRKGLLMTSAIDTAEGALLRRGPALARQGDEWCAPGVLQGQVDLLIRLYSIARVLVGKRHKVPVYLAGVCGSHMGMLGSRFLADSMVVNPSWVVSTGPTHLELCSMSFGQLHLSLRLWIGARSRDTKGYARRVDIKARSHTRDWLDLSESVGALELSLAVLLQASQKGFDFQWTDVQAQGPRNQPPDVSLVSVHIATFQFEDFRAFVSSWIEEHGLQDHFDVNFDAEAKAGAQFLPDTLIQALLEVDLLAKDLRQELQGDFEGGIHSVSVQQDEITIGVTACSLQQEVLAKAEALFKERTTTLCREKNLMRSSVQRLSMVHPGVTTQPESLMSLTRRESWDDLPALALTDAGVFTQKNYPTLITGIGGGAERPLSETERVSTAQVLEAVKSCSDFLREVCF